MSIFFKDRRDRVNRDRVTVDLFLRLKRLKDQMIEFLTLVDYNEVKYRMELWGDDRTLCSRIFFN